MARPSATAATLFEPLTPASKYDDPDYELKVLCWRQSKPERDAH